MRDTIILAGGFGLDVLGASAVRALGLAHLFTSLGYKVIVIGKFKAVHEEARTPDGLFINGICCRDILKPLAGKSCNSYIISSEPLMQVIQEIGEQRVCAVLCYNYPARGAWALIRQAQQHGFAAVMDCTEWYGWEGKKVLRNLWRLFGVEVRMRLLTRLAGNVICASSWFQARVAQQHTLRMPFVLDTTRPEWRRGVLPETFGPLHFVYSGSPGVGMHKDRLPIMIAALSRLSGQGYRFYLSIVGISKKEYLEVIQEHAVQVGDMGDKVRFLGRISHGESLSLLRTADFSIFFRRPNRVSNTGFATKFVEAMTLGIPVITNPTSDFKLYLRDGENGILARTIEDHDIDDALRRAFNLTPEQRAAMISSCRSENPFDMRSWSKGTRSFLENLRGLR